MNELLNTKQAAKFLKLTPSRVARLCADKVLPASNLGAQWVIRREDLEAFAKVQRKAGRPRKDGAK